MKSMLNMTYAVAVAILLAAGMPAAAQKPAEKAAYPTRPIRLIVPFAPGGGTDIIARLLAEEFSRTWGESVVVDNRAGGGGVVGVTTTVRSGPDGHTMVLCSLGYSNAPALHPTPPYDAQKDLVPISLVAIQPFAYVTLPSLGVNSMKELVALAKAKPGEIRYGSGGSGGASHLGTELLKVMTGVNMAHVPYKGTSLALNAVLAGEIHVQLIGVSAVVPFMKTGRMRVLAVSGAKRSAALPDVPTVAENGVPGYEFDVWYGMLFPAGTPRAIVNKVNAEIHRAIKSPALVQRFATVGVEPTGSTPEAFAEIIRSEVAKWDPLVKSARTE